MKVRISCPGYHTLYKIAAEGTSTIDNLKKSQSCFGDFFYYRESSDREKRNINAEVLITMGPTDVEKGRNNICFLTVEELIWYLNELTKVVPYTYNLNKVEGDQYKIALETNATNIELKWLLTCIRYVYELPYSEAIKDAVVLKLNKKFVNVNILNVFNIIGACLKGSNSWGSGHAATSCNYYVCTFVNYKQLARKLADPSVLRINDHLYTSLGSNPKQAMSFSNTIDNNTFSLLSVYTRYKEYYFPLYRWIQQHPNYLEK